MGVLLWIVRLLVVLLVLRLIVIFVRSVLQGAAPSPPRARGRSTPERLGGKLVQDPECGTYVAEERAIRHGRGDRTQFFCSEACRDRWVNRGERPAAVPE